MIKFYTSRNLKKLFYFRSDTQYSTYLAPSISSKSIKMASSTFGDDSPAPPLIINHALFGAKNNWRSICSVLKDKLEPKRKIYTVDARNHGDSPHVPEHTYQHLASDLQYFIKQNNIDKTVLLGHSMGGRTPHLVERAIIVDISPIGTPRDTTEYLEILNALRKVNIPSNVKMPQGRIMARDQLKGEIRGGKLVVNFLLQHLRKNKSGSYEWALNLDGLQNSMDKFMTFPEYILSKKFNNKVLFIAGKHSNFINEDDWPAIQHTFPNSELVWVDAGHIVHIEQPEETIKLITNFLNN